MPAGNSRTHRVFQHDETKREILALTPHRLIALAFGVTATAAHASDSEIRSADQRVTQLQKSFSQAHKSGDAAAIASERAKLQAARAVAWGRRNSAKAPDPRGAPR